MKNLNIAVLAVLGMALSPGAMAAADDDVTIRMMDADEQATEAVTNRIELPEATRERARKQEQFANQNRHRDGEGSGDGDMDQDQQRDQLRERAQDSDQDREMERVREREQTRERDREMDRDDRKAIEQDGVNRDELQSRERVHEAERSQAGQ